MNLGQNTRPELILLKERFSPGSPLDITVLSGEEKENEEEKRGGWRGWKWRQEGRRKENRRSREGEGELEGGEARMWKGGREQHLSGLGSQLSVNLDVPTATS